jgi:tRNA wybutosine-synthesizing protein 3
LVKHRDSDFISPKKLLFLISYSFRANAKLVYACEWNPNALEALRRNVSDNSVEDQCIILEGDNRVTAPKVCTGQLSSFGLIHEL